jgi:hypothetical protein
MKVKKSRVLFIAALFFLSLGVYLLRSVGEVIENSEINAGEGIAFMFIAFTLATGFGIMYAIKNL